MIAFILELLVNLINKFHKNVSRKLQNVVLWDIERPEANKKTGLLRLTQQIDLLIIFYFSFSLMLNYIDPILISSEPCTVR